MRKPQDYAIYKGDEFIDLGTIKELSQRLGIAQKSLRFYSTPTYQSRVGDDGIIVFKIGDEK